MHRTDDLAHFKAFTATLALGGNSTAPLVLTSKIPWGVEMPWVYRSKEGRRGDFKSKLKRWAFDHSSQVTEIEVGSIVVGAVLIMMALAKKLVW